MKVKICGITRQQDADDAVEAGADALGFIFAESSPRFIEPDVAQSIIKTLPPFVAAVGVFVNAPRNKILDVIRITGIGCLQLHGDEKPGDAEGYSIPVYKAFHVGHDFDIKMLGHYKTSAYLLDTFVNGQHGGTSRIFDWQVAVDAKRYGRIILSGGITPENVSEAVRVVNPYAVDVNSGVESSPGKKDKSRIRQFFSAIRNV